MLTPPADHIARATVLAALTCTGDRSGGAPVFSCDRLPSTRTVHATDVTLGAQNSNVTLTSSNASYSAVTDTFKVNVAIQNLLTQPLGTPDGTADSKVRIFVASGPVVVAGTGSISVVADSIGTFTASGQPYYIYSQIIQPGFTSTLRTWKFVLPPTVTRFYFAVYVTGAVPSQTGVLQWTVLRPAGISMQSYEAVWANSASDIFAAGLGSAVAHYNGSAWSLLTSPGIGDLQGLVAFPSDTAWVVGIAGARARWNGTAWTTFSTPAFGGTLYATWGTSTSDVYAVGDSAKIFHWTGSAWTAESPPTGFTTALRGVWGAADGSVVYAVGLNGSILERLAGVWTKLSSPITSDLRGIWGTGTQFYAVGVSGKIITSSSGGAWTAMTSPVTSTLKELGGASATDIYAAGDVGTVLHYNGIAWSIVSTPFVQALYGVVDGGAGGTTWALGQNGTIFSYNGTSWTFDPASGIPVQGLFATSPSDVWVAGVTGVLLHYDGTSWTMTNPGGTQVNALWGTSSSNIYGVGAAGRYAIYNGSTWSSGSVGAAHALHDVWGTTATNVYTVGDTGAVYRYNGTSWAPMSQSATTGTLNAVWGTDSNNVFAVGTGGAIIRYNAGAWSSMISGTTATLNGVAGANPSNVYAVGDTGIVLSYANVGSAWTRQPPASRSLEDIWVADSSHVYAAAASGNMWVFNGSQWYTLSIGVTTALYAVSGTSATSVYVGGNLGLILVGEP
jgi:hypothetical protein